MARRSEQPSDDPAMGSVDPALHPPVVIPDEDWAWFAARAATLGIADVASRRTAIEALYGHMIGVNRWLNLTTIVAPREYLKLHVLDSLAALADPRLRHLGEGSPCVDLGSGGGYPGLPLALWTPRVAWVLVDSRRKKADFLAAAGALIGRVSDAGRVSARHLRGGETPTAAPDLWRKCQLVVSRAMGQAGDVLAEAADLVRPHGHVVIYKGPAFAGDEKAATLESGGRLGYRFVAERRVRLDDADPERVLVVFERIR
ncbi:MAG: class I SAM-dependent methyltransferase [Planctomycetes bacterium]|nr:class I SAM-dependent methyltransferase [Planctomycetota bacterium]